MNFPQDPPETPPRNGGALPPRHIKSYVRRAGRVTAAQMRALQELAPRFVLPRPAATAATAATAAPLDIAAAFGSGRAGAPLVLEIGFGMGEATAQIALARPDDNFLCCEVHKAGVGALLKRIGEQAIGNIRIVQHDAVQVLEHLLPDAGLDGVHIFFPDPWHKSRHHKRRLVQPPFARLLARRMQSGAYLHCATDWQPYAEHMLHVLQAEPLLANTAADYAPKPAYRPLTKFENRGLRLGHGVRDLVFVRR